MYTSGVNKKDKAALTFCFVKRPGIAILFFVGKECLIKNRGGEAHQRVKDQVGVPNFRHFEHQRGVVGGGDQLVDILGGEAPLLEIYGRREAQLDETAQRPFDIPRREGIARMEREMERLQQDHRVAEDTLGETMLVLVVAKGYLARLLRNEAVSGYLSRPHPDLSAELTSVMEAVGTDARSVARE